MSTKENVSYDWRFMSKFKVWVSTKVNVTVSLCWKAEEKEKWHINGRKTDLKTHYEYDTKLNNCFCCDWPEKSYENFKFTPKCDYVYNTHCYRMYKTLLEDSPPHFGIYVRIVEDRLWWCLRITFKNVCIVNSLGRKQYSFSLCKGHIYLNSF